jgi:hypothetical protein
MGITKIPKPLRPPPESMANQKIVITLSQP